MRAYYVDFYGCHADLCQYLNRETTRLTIRSRDGAIIHRKEYRTWRGAKIAMGKLGDCWRNELLSAKSEPREI